MMSKCGKESLTDSEAQSLDDGPVWVQQGLPIVFSTGGCRGILTCNSLI
jgi:hypothetical protein